MFVTSIPKNKGNNYKSNGCKNTSAEYKLSTNCNKYHWIMIAH